MPFTEEEIDSMRMDCFAADVPFDMEMGLADCTEEDIIEYFESGGETLPPGCQKPKPKPKEKKKKKKAAAQAEEEPTKKDEPLAREQEAVQEERETRTVKSVLCLHGAGASAKIMQKQLRPLGLEAAGFELHVLDGCRPVDTSKHPETKQLKMFYPNFDNVAYMELMQVHTRTKEEKVVLLETKALEHLDAYNKPRQMMWDRKREPPGLWRLEYRGVEEALTLLARTLAASVPPAGSTGLLAFSQGANLVIMLLALIHAADDGSPAAAKRLRLLLPSCVVLICPSDEWMHQFKDPIFAAKALAAVDAGIEQPAVSSSSSSASAVDVSDGAAAAGGDASAGAPPAAVAELPGVFGKKMDVPSLFILGQQDLGFEAGRDASEVFAKARFGLHDEAHRIPQDGPSAEQIATFLRAHEGPMREE